MTSSKSVVSKMQFHFNSSEYPYKGPITAQPHCHQAVVLCIRRDLLAQSPQTFRDFKNGLGKKIHQTALMAFTHCIQEIRHCISKPPDDEDNDGKPPDDKYYFIPGCNPTEDSIALPRAETVFEYVMNTSDPPDWIGIRIWFIPIDPRINFGTGIQSIIAENADDKSSLQKAKKRGGRVTHADPKTWESYKHITDMSIWATQISDGYRNNTDCADKESEVFYPLRDLGHEKNPACPYRVFSIDQAMHLFSRERGVNASQCDVQNYHQTTGVNEQGVWTFPVSNATFLMRRAYMHPKLMVSVPFPQMADSAFQHTLSSVASKQAFNPGIINVFAMRDFLVDDQGKCVSDIHLLAEYAKQRLKRIAGMPKWPKGDRLEALHRFKSETMDAFGKTWNVDSNISEMSKNMIRWFNRRNEILEEHGDVPTVTSKDRTLYDAKLSTFANFMIQKMQAFEDLLQVSTAHRQLLILYIARLDAYRRAFGLHSNALLTGAGASSKSFVLEVIEKLSIPDTTINITHQTSKADTIEDDQNDMINIYHEMPPSILGIDPKYSGSDTGDPLMKEKLTSQRMKTKAFHFDDVTGKRGNRIMSSEQIGVLMGATNDPPSRIPEAMLTRFMVLTFSKYKRTGREVNDLMGTTMPDTVKVLVEEFVDQCRVEQYLVCLVEKMIWTNVMRDVNMNVAFSVFRKALRYLDTHGVPRASQPRNFERLKITARALTIMAAINTTFNHTTSNDTKPWDMTRMRDVERWLVCTEEIAYFTLTLLQDMFINPVLPHIVRALADHFCHYTKKFETAEACIYAGDPQAPDFNYVRIAKDITLPKLAAKIAPLMKTAKVSANNILFELNDLQEMSLVLPARNGTSVLDNTHTITLVKSEKDTAGTTCVYISTEFLDRVLYSGTSPNVMTDAIESTFHFHSNKRTVITGETFIHDGGTLHPHFLKTLEVEPNTMRMTILNAAYVEDHAGENEKPIYAVDQDMESIERERHWNAIGLWSGAKRKFATKRKRSMYTNATKKRKENTYPSTYRDLDNARAKIIKGLQRDPKKYDPAGVYNLSRSVK